jgi:hypothetical protein
MQTDKESDFDYRIVKTALGLWMVYDHKGKWVGVFKSPLEASAWARKQILLKNEQGSEK